MSTFPNNLVAITFAAGTFIVTALLAWTLHSWDVNRIEANIKKALADQKTALQAECSNDKKITYDVGKNYEDDLVTIDGQLSSLLVRDPERCVLPIANTPGQHNDAKGSKLSRENGVTAQAFYIFAGDAEKTRVQLKACQSFIRKTWEAKKN